ncbi:transmembrane protein, putative [Medicago truncatula]|uniref:Transmembrane protein, putative n=1 Tax=Medicago truncatula TaxID=3880 RepID=G7JYI7_MEDTR|nr:transmembrane protein, putative [Medicago truncatula]
MVCCLSSCAIKYSIKDSGVKDVDLEAMDISITLILSYIFVGIMPLYMLLTWML